MASQRLRDYFFQITNVLRADGTTGGVRFRKTDKPTQVSFADLFKSIPFFKESSDRAKTYTGSTDYGTQQGLATLSTDTQAKANQSQLSTVSLVVQPHQLPTVESTTSDFTISTVPSDGAPSASADAFDLVPDSTTTRNRYILKWKTAFIKFILRRIVPSGGNTADVLLKNSSTSYDYQFGNLATNSTFISSLLANATFVNNLTTQIITNNPNAISEALEVGFMRYHPVTTMPSSKWLRMDGSAISRTTYSALFSLIGTTYGVGDGSTTFNLPDFRDKQATGYSGTKTIGSTSGSETHTVTSSNLPTHVHDMSSAVLTNNTHNHDFSVVNTSGVTTSSNTYVKSLAITIGAGVAQELLTNQVEGSVGITDDIKIKNDTHTHTVSGNTGNGGFANTAINHLDPYLATNFIIKVLA